MTLARALICFVIEALESLRRSWRVGLLAVLTIATSLFVLGLFLLVTHNLAALVTQWHREAKVIVYFTEEASAEELDRLRSRASEQPGVTEATVIDQERARRRFERLFPGLVGVVLGDGAEALPASLEIRARDGASEPVAAWAATLVSDPAVAAVDDDRDWLGQVQAVGGFLRLMGLGLGGLLLAAAVFTIAAVIRLTFYRYREEVAVMRLVGATEFLIRGPFYLSGLVQGLLGGLLGVAGLRLAYRFLRPEAPVALFSAVLEGGFLPASRLVTLVLVGAAAGLVGAMLSLRRER